MSGSTARSSVVLVVVLLHGDGSFGRRDKVVVRQAPIVGLTRFWRERGGV